MDRTIQISLQKKLESERIEKLTQSMSLQNQQRDLRNRLYLFGLQHGKQIGENYQNRFEHIDGIEITTNRAQDIWAPMLVIANYLDHQIPDTDVKHVTGYVKRLIMDYYEMHNNNDDIDNIVVKIVAALEDIYEHCPNGQDMPYMEKKIPTDEVYRYLIEHHEFPREVKKRQLTQKMKTLGIDSSVTNLNGRSVRTYTINIEKIDELKSRYLTRSRDIRFITRVQDDVRTSRLMSLDEFLQ
jgi:hypothetical protein